MDELVVELLQLSDVTFKEKAKVLGVKIGIVSKTTKKLYAKKLARAILENAGKSQDPPPSVGCTPDEIPIQQKVQKFCFFCQKLCFFFVKNSKFY